MTQNQTPIPNAEEMIDDILKAAGSGFRHYTMAKTRADIFNAAHKHLNPLVDANAALVEALEMYMQVGDQCSRGYLGQCEQKAKAALALAKVQS